MDAAMDRPHLPALRRLDLDRAKKEEDASQSNSKGAGQSLSASKVPSPPYYYPSGAPPPYSQTSAPPTMQQTAPWHSVHPSTHTPPESRRSSQEDKDGLPRPPPSQPLLPSISEALRADGQSFSNPARPPSRQSTLPPQSTPTTTASPLLGSRPSFSMDPPSLPPTNHGPSSGYPYPQPHTDPDGQSRPSLAMPDPPRAGFSSPLESKPRPYAHSGGATSGPAFGYTHASEPPSSHEPSSTHGPHSYPYGYTAYPPRYSSDRPPLPSSNPIYHPSTAHGASPPLSSSWKSEPLSRYDDRSGTGLNHGERVKRHLDMYDLEMALNDITQTSRILSDFARRYGDRMHHTQRTGASLSTLPSLVEVEDMIDKSRAQIDALVRVRDVIVTQQLAFEQNGQDQRHRHKPFGDPILSAAAKVVAPPENDDSQSGTFVSADAKKRRGRAAAPGRCHSCNRAETPEWRRGPDGARTLCNACGLHYAKLTRKNNANKNAALGGSNLRPKEGQP